jgi:hypothetical protein
MAPKRARQVTLWLSLFGVSLSGALSCRELFGSGVLSCPSPGAPGTLFGYPACVYGFFMYLILAVVSALGLAGTRNRTPVV